MDDAALPGSHDEVGPTDATPTVGFLELFYDLVFVAATMVLSNAFSARPEWGWALSCVVVFVLLWVLWFTTTTLMNVERADDFGHRALILVQMFLISLVVLAFADKEATNNDVLGLAYALALVVVAAMHHRAGRLNPGCASWARVRRNRLLAAALLVSATTFTPDHIDDVVFVVAAMGLLIPSAIGRDRRSPFPTVDTHHLLERAALLTLIMCGEAFVKVALVVSEGAVEANDVLAMAVEFVGIFALWFVYFDDIPRAGIRPGLVSAELWALSHLPLQIGIVAVAVGISKFLQTSTHPVHDEAVVILGVGFAAVYGGLALVGLLGLRTPIAPLTSARLGVAGLTGVLAFGAWTFSWFTPAQLLLALAGLAVLHAVWAQHLRGQTVVPRH